MSYSAKAFPITRLSRSWLVITFAVATGFGNGRPVRGLTPVKYSPPVTVTGSVGGAVRASSITDAAPPLGRTCACERLKLRRFASRDFLLMFRVRVRRREPRL